MVLESLLHPLQAEKKPWHLFFIGAIYSSIAIFLSLWIFHKDASFVMVFLTVLACVPIIYNTLKFEEEQDLILPTEKKIMHHHNKAILVFAYLFLGIAVACVLWFTLLPENLTQFAFQQQLNTLQEINNRVSGSYTGSAVGGQTLFAILFNNIKVLAFCVIFAFIYGAGAIFILTWNATVIAAAIGNFIRSNWALITGVGSQAALVSTGFLKYAIHGIPEIIGYFYGALAGGIISVALIKNHFSTPKAQAILFDVAELLLLALGFLLVGGIFEVYLTPLLF